MDGVMTSGDVRRKAPKARSTASTSRRRTGREGARPYALGLDLGGTNVKALAVTPAGRVLAFAASPHGRRRTWTNAVRALVRQMHSRTWLPPPPGWESPRPDSRPRDAASIAFMPGRLPGLEGMHWGRFLRVDRGVPVLNDAQAALVGETWRGAARGTTNALLLTLGTGVGGAALVDGRVLHGHLGRAGHLGHVSLDPEGALDIVNTPGSLEDAIGDCTVAHRTGGRFDTTRALVEASSNGDREARRVWRTSIRALAAATASLVNVLDPEVVVIGGGIAQCGAALFGPLRREMARVEWRPAGARVRIVPAALGDRAGAWGAAKQAMDAAATRRCMNATSSGP